MSRLTQHIAEDIQAKFNLDIELLDRGRVVDARRVHNIFVDLGREWLASLVGFAGFSPDTVETDARVKYMGLGIGGSKQLATSTILPAVANAYSGTNTQTDLDRTVTALERPVRVSGATTTYPGDSGDVWLGLLQAPTGHPVATRAQFRRVFSRDEISYGSFTEVPLSEAGLFLSDKDPGFYNNTLVAYDTFPTITKTVAFDLQVTWTLIF